MRRVVHVHLHRTGDALPLAELYRDLAERMWAAARALDGRTGDDLQGHAFHGNQWTGGIAGPHKEKPTKAHLAGVKGGFAKMHALLSSGHPFTKAEMIEAAELSGEKKLTDYLAMLKNPKYAGKLGALQIEKNQEGHYFVALPNGQPAPPLSDADLNAALHAHLTEPAKGHDPSTQAAMANLMAHAPAATAVIKKAKAAKPAPPSAEEQSHLDKPPDAAYEAEFAPKTGLAALKAAHPGSMPKAEADKHYQDALDDAYSLFSVSKLGAHAAALTFKNAKAEAMAAWASAVHGTSYAPKPQAVFMADLQLAADAKAFSKAAALNNWKANTAAEKMGNFPAKPVVPVSKAATHHAPAPAADMGHPAPVAPLDYAAIVPDDFAPIGEADITGGKYAKGVSKLKASLAAESSENAVANKKTIEHKLRERLAGKPNFAALVKRLGLAKEGQGSLESKLIQAWAGSSGDHHDVSVALQLAVRDAFGIPDADVEKKALGSLKQHGGDEAKVVSAGIRSMNMNMTPLAEHEVPTAKAALMEFVHAQYEETQALLKKRGHDHVYLARGMKFTATHDNAEGPASLKLQPASSFSTNYSTAKNFAGGGTVFLTKVPRQQVLSTFLTGFGCTGENEVVVLAHGKMKAYAVDAYSGATSHTGAEQHLSSQIAAKKTKAPAVTVHAPAAHKAPAPSAGPAAVLAAAKKASVNATSKWSKTAALANKTGLKVYVEKAAKYKAEADAAKAAYNGLKKIAT